MNSFYGTASTASGSSISSLKRSYPFETDEQSQTPTSSSSTPSLSQQTTEIGNTEPTENICFGSIIGVSVQLSNTGGTSQWNSWANGSTQLFEIVQEGDYFSLERDNIKFGRLTKGLCRHLNDLVTKKTVRIKAHVSTDDWNKAMSEWRPQTATKLPAEVSIYGSKADAKFVGRLLSNSGIFLQMPRHKLDNAEYYNPHVIRIQGYAEPSSTEPPPPSFRVESGTPDILDRAGDEEEARNNDTAVVDSILDSCSHHNVPREIITVQGIRSDLLPHQQEAIDFIFQREKEKIASDDLSLWKYNDKDEDEPFYQHVLSGAKQPERAETRGGIIADEMGLGKSLVILSTIAGSLDRANEFVNNENQLRVSQPLNKAASGATLILVPSSLLIDNWVDEIRKHTNPGTLPFHKHLGPERHKETNLLYERPVVFTTYATVAAESRRGNNTLANINWFRIVLDEAHEIRNRTTKQFQAIASISAAHRWCLTGTPIQNSLDDLGALVSFLKVPILEKPPTFRKLITSPISSTSTSRTRFKNLQTLLQTICLRRTRKLLDLPKPVSKLRKLALTPEEHNEYQNLLARGRTEIDMAVSRRGKRNLNSVFLESLLRLRLFCNNGSTDTVIQPGTTGLSADSDEILAYLQQQGQDHCAYCSAVIYFINPEVETDGGMLIPSCGHLVCHHCVPNFRTEGQRCPTCASNDGSEPQVIPPLNHLSISPTRGNNGSIARPVSQYPSKLLQLLADIRESSTHKSIVFSCWKKTLNLVQELLNISNIRCVMVDGSLPLAQRLRVLKEFRSPIGANILLMTLGTGAVGLNLAIASRIYLLEPQWNPSIESQAIGRALRLGQTAEVVIMRYIVADTIEDKNVLSRQVRKLELAGGGFNKRKDMQPDRLQALQDVFGVNQELI